MYVYVQMCVGVHVCIGVDVDVDVWAKYRLKQVNPSENSLLDVDVDFCMANRWTQRALVLLCTGYTI